MQRGIHWKQTVILKDDVGERNASIKHDNIYNCFDILFCIRKVENRNTYFLLFFSKNPIQFLYLCAIVTPKIIRNMEKCNKLKVIFIRVIVLLNKAYVTMTKNCGLPSFNGQKGIHCSTLGINFKQSS